MKYLLSVLVLMGASQVFANSAEMKINSMLKNTKKVSLQRDISNSQDQLEKYYFALELFCEFEEQCSQHDFYKKVALDIAFEEAKIESKKYELSSLR